MKRKSQTPRPTAGEWEILEVLWQTGGATVRQVHEALPAKRPSQYTTTLKLMQIMTEKGLVTRDESQRAHQYRAVVAREESQARLVDELLQRVFGGSAARLVTDGRLAPGFGAKHLAAIMAEHRGARGLMLVGHEPDFSTVISACIGGGRIECKKGGLARVDIEDPTTLAGLLVWLLPPRVLAPNPPPVAT